VNQKKKKTVFQLFPSFSRTAKKPWSLKELELGAQMACQVRSADVLKKEIN
jgi:hypothetical protein